MKILINILILFFVLTNYSFAFDKFECNGIKLEREGYSVCYNPLKKIPYWVSYDLTKESVGKRFKRSNKFKEDKELPIQYRSTLQDYKHSGFDRGHLAPNAAMDFNIKSMNESFLLSNMAPQIAGLNRIEWRKLEEYVRDEVKKQDLFVITGCISLTNRYIGNKVYIPDLFFKIIYFKKSQKTECYLLPNENVMNWRDYKTNIDKIRKLLIIDK